MLQDRDAARSRRVMQTMLAVRKLDIGALTRAYEQA